MAQGESPTHTQIPPPQLLSRRAQLRVMGLQFHLCFSGWESRAYLSLSSHLLGKCNVQYQLGKQDDLYCRYAAELRRTRGDRKEKKKEKKRDCRGEWRLARKTSAKDKQMQTEETLVIPIFTRERERERERKLGGQEGTLLQRGVIDCKMRAKNSITSGPTKDAARFFSRLNNCKCHKDSKRNASSFWSA